MGFGREPSKFFHFLSLEGLVYKPVFYEKTRVTYFLDNMIVISLLLRSDEVLHKAHILHTRITRKQFNHI